MYIHHNMRTGNKIKRAKALRLCWLLTEMMSQATFQVKTAESKTLKLVWYIVIIGGIIGHGFLLRVLFTYFSFTKFVLINNQLLKRTHSKTRSKKEHQNHSTIVYVIFTRTQQWMLSTNSSLSSLDCQRLPFVRIRFIRSV